ncbi:acetoin reductase [Lineolata rhizophorae]|uniref:Acetoin reductase n=1 Tax=Lineolata rhizophorae TaxID=578093 RepID=A0A6A6NWH9_9PEZI|nr:acetoin reductase [Lineolata rhizophorae]
MTARFLRSHISPAAALSRTSDVGVRRAACNAAPRAFSTSNRRDKTAIVTGASRGIGAAISRRLASDGYNLVLNDIPVQSSALDGIASEITSSNPGRKAVPFVGDVSMVGDVERLVQASVDEFGSLETMVANAGIAQVKHSLDLTKEDWQRMFDVNVMGVFNCYQQAAKQMIKQGSGGKLLGAASIVAFKPFPCLNNYSASKFAVRGLTQCMAMELAEYKITANAYAPGIVGTAMWDLIDEKLGERSGRPKGETIKKFSQELIALGRTSVPEDVAKLVSFLASDDSEYVTGQTMVVDGGIIMT